MMFFLGDPKYHSFNWKERERERERGGEYTRARIAVRKKGALNLKKKKINHPNDSISNIFIALDDGDIISC